MGEKQLGNGGKALDPLRPSSVPLTGLQGEKAVLGECASGAFWAAASGPC